jgi:hypothetical protein
MTKYTQTQHTLQPCRWLTNFFAFGKSSKTRKNKMIWLEVWNMFPIYWENHPNWLIFFTMVETTNQWYKMIYWYTTLRFTQGDCNGLSPPLQGTYLFMGSTMAVMYFRLLQAWSTEKRYQFLKPYFHRYWATRIVAVIRNNMFLTYCFPKKHTDTDIYGHPGIQKNKNP